MKSPDSLMIAQHLPVLDGVRAVAALGIIVTHVSFQVGTGWAFADRFDYFVAVFFALSAFLLYRRPSPARRYYRNRAARIIPAYLVCVVSVLLFLPEAARVDWVQVVANLTSTQVFWPGGLAPGLTHLWSLCIEISFYLVLPAVVWALRGRAARVRVLLIVGAAAVSFVWPWLPFVAAFDGEGINFQIWPPSYAPWFAVGMVAAEAEGALATRRAAGRAAPRVVRLLEVRWVWWLVAAAVMWLASRPFVGPVGLVHPAPGEFNVRILLGAVFAAAVVVPYALAPGRDRVLNSPVVQALGRWSYSIFLWHVAVLGVTFPLTGVGLFSGGAGNFAVILAATVALTIPVAAASYVLVEEPLRTLVRRLPASSAGESHRRIRR